MSKVLEMISRLEKDLSHQILFKLLNCLKGLSQNSKFPHCIKCSTSTYIHFKLKEEPSYYAAGLISHLTNLQQLVVIIAPSIVAFNIQNVNACFRVDACER